METFLTIIGLIVLLHFLSENVFKFNNDQLNISLYGIHKIPKVILELANIDKNNNNSYADLSRDEQEKYTKVNEKLHEAIFSTLTYIRSHNLIHIQKADRSYFYKISNNDRYLINDGIGELSNNRELRYVLYRKDNGWLRGSTLIGYFIKKKKHLEKEEVIRLFEFPEILITRRFFTKGLQKKYQLKEDVVADYIEKDDLGYSGSFCHVSYETDNKDGINFWFRIY